MEGQVIEQAQFVQMSVVSIITIASTIIAALAATIGLLFRMLEKKNDKIIELTTSFIETTIGVKNTVNATKEVIEKLPENIIILIKANGK